MKYRLQKSVDDKVWQDTETTFKSKKAVDAFVTDAVNKAVRVNGLDWRVGDYWREYRGDDGIAWYYRVVPVDS